MNAINKLGLKIAAITALVLMLGYGIFWGARQAWQRVFETTSPTPAPAAAVSVPGSSPAASGSTDTDGDGIPDTFEQSFYQTNPGLADSDGDGEYDLMEVTQGRDPLKAGPNDEIKPPTGSRVTDTNTYTARYLASLPDNASRSEILEKARLETFVAANSGTIMPAAAVETSKESGKAAVAAYLDAISTAHNQELTAVSSEQIEQAFRDQVARPETLKEVLASLKKNVATLEKIAAPAETAELHKQYIGASRGLVEGVELLVNMPNDLVGGMVGAKKIELAGAAFQEVATQVKQLETKYGL